MTHDLLEALEEWRAARQDIFENTTGISGENAARWKRLSNAENILMNAITALEPPPAAGCPDWGQIVQSLLRSMDHPFKGESSSEQAERMADDLCKKYPALRREAPAPSDTVNESAEARLREALERTRAILKGPHYQGGASLMAMGEAYSVVDKALSADGDEARKSEDGTFTNCASCDMPRTCLDHGRCFGPPAAEPGYAAGFEACRKAAKDIANYHAVGNGDQYDDADIGGCTTATAIHDAIAALPQPITPKRHSIEFDGFTGTVIGYYTTLEGKEGVVLQQDGTRVVHVYGRKHLKPAAAENGDG